jgi:hypothetical protein
VNNQQVAAVLAKIQLGDNRETDAAGLVLAEWVDSIGDLDFDDAVEAVRMHRRETTVYLQPAHVRANVRLLRARRERDVRVSQPMVAATPITLDRAEFDRLTALAIAEHRAGKAMRS